MRPAHPLNQQASSVSNWLAGKCHYAESDLLRRGGPRPNTETSTTTSTVPLTRVPWRKGSSHPQILGSLLRVEKWQVSGERHCYKEPIFSLSFVDGVSPLSRVLLFGPRSISLLPSPCHYS